MFKLKPISHGSVGAALAKAERYRFLNEPHEAESICRDILAVDPENREARISLILALTDELPQEGVFSSTLAALSGLETPYDRAYYSGIAWERRAKVCHDAGRLGSSGYAYDWLVKALELFEEAERLQPPGNDDAILRWNACVRFLERHKELKERTEDVRESLLLE